MKIFINAFQFKLLTTKVGKVGNNLKNFGKKLSGFIKL